MESELTQYMVIFAGAILFLLLVIVVVFAIALMREMRLKTEEAMLANHGFQLNPVIIRNHLHYVTPMNDAYPYEIDIPMEENPVTRLPRPLFVAERAMIDAANHQQRSVEVPAVTVEPARTLHAS